MLMMNFGMIGGIFVQMSFVLGSSDKVMQLILYECKMKIEGGVKMPEAECQKGILEFKNVNFTYPCRDDVHVLKDVSFTVDAEKKRVIALCGTSGSGKSTCVAMCERFYDPDSGTVLFNGKDIRELEPKWYH